MEMGFVDLFATLPVGGKIFFGAIVAMWFLVMWFTDGKGLSNTDPFELQESFEEERDRSYTFNPSYAGLPGNAYTTCYEEEERLP